MKVGIYLPYRHCEATYMGLRLAEVALLQNRQVSLMSAGYAKNRNGVDHYWDRHIRSRRKYLFESWMDSVDCVVFLTMEHLVDVATARLKKTRSILVANWHEWFERCPPGLFDAIICPSRDAYSIVNGRKDENWAPVQCIPWDAGVPRIHRYKIRDSDFLRVYVPVDPYTLSKTATGIAYVLGRLLEAHRQARFTLATFRSVPKSIAGTIKSLEKTGKLSWERFPSYQRQLRLLKSHDLTWAPSLRSEAGWFALQSVEAGVPVIAYNVPPSQEFLRQDVNAQFVHCDLRFSQLGAAEALPSVASVLCALDSVLSHPRILQNIWQTQENHSVRRSNFHSKWNRIWGGNNDGSPIG